MQREPVWRNNIWAELENEKGTSHGKSYQLIPDRRNGKYKRPEARIILLVQRNGKEAGKARASMKEGDAMAPGGKWFGNQ